jgi:hypothetical protein
LPVYAKFGWIFGFMKSGFYDRGFLVVSYTAMRLSWNFLLAVGAGFAGFLCFLDVHFFGWENPGGIRIFNGFGSGRFHMPGLSETLRPVRGQPTE